MVILIIGCAGFLGSGLARRILRTSYADEVIGVDTLGAPYGEKLQKEHLRELRKYPNFTFKKLDITDGYKLERLFFDYSPQVVVNLSGAVPRPEDAPDFDDYIETGLVGFYNVLEACRHARESVQRLVFASVPLQNEEMPLTVLSAAKRAQEGLAYAYAAQFGLPCVAVRLEAVFGPGEPPGSFCTRYANALRGEPVVGQFEENLRLSLIDDAAKELEEAALGPFDQIAQDGLRGVAYRVYNKTKAYTIKRPELERMLQAELVAAGAVRPKKKGAAAATAQTKNTMPDLQKGLKNFAEWYREFKGEQL